jgi:hypothetical protein
VKLSRDGNERVYLSALPYYARRGGDLVKGICGVDVIDLSSVKLNRGQWDGNKSCCCVGWEHCMSRGRDGIGDPEKNKNPQG